MTGSLFGVLIVLIEFAIAEVFVSVDKEVCCEIKSKINSYMFKIMFLQLLITKYFVKSD